MNAAAMNKFWVVVWQEKKGSSPVLRSTHVNDRSAKQKAKDISIKFGYAQFAEVIDNKVSYKATYEAGKKTREESGTGEFVASDHEDPVEKAMVDDGVAEKKPKALRKLPKAGAEKSAEPVAEKPKKVAAKKVDVSAEAPSVAVKRKPVAKGTDAIVEQFEPREGTLRKKVIEMLAKNIDKPVSIVDLQTAVYGEYKDQYMPAIKMVLKGVRVMIEQKGLPYELEHGKYAGENAYTLKVK